MQVQLNTMLPATNPAPAGDRPSGEAGPEFGSLLSGLLQESDSTVPVLPAEGSPRDAGDEGHQLPPELAAWPCQMLIIPPGPLPVLTGEGLLGTPELAVLAPSDLSGEEVVSLPVAGAPERTGPGQGGPVEAQAASVAVRAFAGSPERTEVQQAVGSLPQWTGSAANGTGSTHLPAHPIPKAEPVVRELAEALARTALQLPESRPMAEAVLPAGQGQAWPAPDQLEVGPEASRSPAVAIPPVSGFSEPAATASETMDTGGRTGWHREGNDGEVLREPMLSQLALTAAQPQPADSLIGGAIAPQPWHRFELPREADLFRQIAQGARQMVEQGRSEMEIRLHPEHLGRLTLRVEMDGRGLKAEFTVTNQAVRATVESGLAGLRAQLEGAGVEVRALTVSVGGDQPRQNFEQGGHTPGRQRRQVMAAMRPGVTATRPTVWPTSGWSSLGRALDCTV